MEEAQYKQHIVSDGATWELESNILQNSQKLMSLIWTILVGSLDSSPAGKMKLEFLENPSSTFAWIFKNIRLIPNSFLGFC